MAYFPMFVDLKNQLCVVIGGGVVAYRKIIALLEFEARIEVIAPQFCDSIQNLTEATDIKRITLKKKHYETADIKEALVVIAGTNDKELNQRIAKECRDRKLPVNVVDVQEECSFIFPAFIKRGAITIGVTSSGKSPIISQRIKNKIKEELPDYLEALVDILGSVREDVKAAFDTEEDRKRVFKKIVEKGCLEQGKLFKSDIEEIIIKEKENNDNT